MRSDNTLVHTNQASAFIDIRRQSDQEFSFWSRKSFNEMIIYFGSNRNYGIIVNPSRTIRIKGPQVTNIIQGRFDIFDSIIKTSDPAYSIVSWQITAKNESENLGGNNIRENAERNDNFEVENVGRKINHIKNYSNQVDSNHADLNKIITAYSTTINDLTSIRALYYVP